MNKLLPCPFCGREIDKADLKYDGVYSWCFCPRCATNGPITGKGLEQAAYLWNQRKGQTMKTFLLVLGGIVFGIVLAWAALTYLLGSMYA